MLGDVRDSGGVKIKMDVETCLRNAGFFWKRNIDLEKCIQIPGSVVGVT